MVPPRVGLQGMGRGGALAYTETWGFRGCTGGQGAACLRIAASLSDWPSVRSLWNIEMRINPLFKNTRIVVFIFL